MEPHEMKQNEEQLLSDLWGAVGDCNTLRECREAHALAVRAERERERGKKMKLSLAQEKALDFLESQYPLRKTTAECAKAGIRQNTLCALERRGLAGSFRPLDQELEYEGKPWVSLR